MYFLLKIGKKEEVTPYAQTFASISGFTLNKKLQKECHKVNPVPAYDSI